MPRDRVWRRGTSWLQRRTRKVGISTGQGGKSDEKGVGGARVIEMSQFVDGLAMVLRGQGWRWSR